MEDNEIRKSRTWLSTAALLLGFSLFLFIVAIWTGSGQVGGTGGILLIPTIITFVVGMVQLGIEEDW